MHTVIATVTTTEMGSVDNVTLSDTTTYKSRQLLSTYGFPYLQSFESSDEWRRALGASLIDTAATLFNLEGCHGDRLAYVSPNCCVYVYEIDFDRAPLPL